ncbi:MAG: hypothetical protein JRE40_06575, partial [Deltaproteobacteria bacterium]|nr:hypothetical protein [Deltaproteobacteria bacterium]
MAKQKDVLAALASREEATTASVLAAEVRASEGTVRSWLSRLKQKGYVDGSAKEGFFITDEGRDALEREEEIPVTPEDVGADTASKIKYYGQLAGIATEKVQGAIELIVSRDPNDLEWVWEALTQMDVPIDKRRVFFNLWRNYCRQGIPPDLREQVVGAEKEEGDKGPHDMRPARGRRDYILVDDEPVRVGEGLGDYTLEDAKEILALRTLKARLHPGGGPSGQQGLSLADVKQIIDWVQGAQQGQGGQKTYVVRPSEGGVRVEEVEEGKPLVVPGSNPSPGKTYYVNPQGEVQEVQPGEPIVIRQAAQPAPQPAKSFYVDPQGNVRELQPGEPIVVRQVAQEPSPRTILIRPDGSTQEVSPGQPIIIERGTTPPEGTLPLQLTDDEGKPLASIRMPLSQFFNYQKETARMRQDEEKHQATLGILGEIRKNIPQAVRAIDTFARTRGGGKAEGAELDLPCQHCGRHNRVAPGPPGSESTFTCEECGEE